MEQDVTFRGIAAPLRLRGAEAVLPVLRQVANGWPRRTAVADPQSNPFFSITALGDDDLFASESHVQETPPRRFDAVNAVCDAMVGLALALPAERPDLLCLHAAGIAMAGRLVIFPNVQRAGKSTLSAALARAGHPLFSDDVVPLSFAPEGAVFGHAMGISPRLRLPLPEALGQGFRDWAEAVAGPRNRQYMYLSLPDQPPHGSVLPLGAFVILDRRDEAMPAKLEHVAPEGAMDALLYQNFTRDRHSGDILRLMAAVLRDRPTFRLIYHDLASAVACLEVAFADWPDAGPDRGDAGSIRFRLADLEARDLPKGQEGGPLRQRAGTVETWLGERLFLADAKGRAIHRIDPIGAAVWLVLAEPATPDEIAEVLAEAFPDAAPDRIADDLQRLLAQFCDAGLIEPAL
jgi:Coenzyme PQQ synthesis protein D (PqqD)